LCIACFSRLGLHLRLLLLLLLLLSRLLLLLRLMLVPFTSSFTNRSISVFIFA
jgi:hypothetical protein